MHILAGVVCPFGAVYQGAALHGNLAAVVLYVLVGFNCTDRHIEMDCNHVAGLPVARQGDITVVPDLCVLPAAVDCDAPPGSQAVGILVQVAGNNFVANPAGNADLDGEFTGFIVLNLYSNIAVSGIICLLGKGHAASVHLDFCGIFSEKIDIQVLAFYAIDIAGN